MGKKREKTKIWYQTNMLLMQVKFFSWQKDDKAGISLIIVSPLSD